MKKLLAMSLGILIAMIGCHPVGGPDKSLAGAILGAGWGAGAGAVIGNQVNDTGPGAAIGAGFGATSGLLTGIGLDIAEETEIEQQREIDALKVQLASNHRNLSMLQDQLDDRDRRLAMTSFTDQIFFDKDQASLRAGSVAQLERLADVIKRNPYIGRVELHGHADSSSEPERNQALSEARARSVGTYLANRGLSMDQLEIVAHGAKQPLASNDTESGRQLNRRVEIVLKK